MNLIPPADVLGIPSPPFIFMALGWITFTFHLIFMNYVLGGTVIVAFQEWFQGRDEQVAKSNLLLVKIMPIALSFAITMGVAPLLFVQVLFGQFFYTANIVMGGFWLSIIALVMIAFYSLYIILALKPASAWIRKILITINMVLFLLVAFIFTNNAVLTENPQYWADIYSGAKNVVAPDPTLIPRYLHNLFGAIPVAGLWLAVIGRYQLRFYPQNEGMAKKMIRAGLLWATITTVIEIVVGGIFLMTMGSERIADFMGNGYLFVGWAIGTCTGVFTLITLILALVTENNSKFIWGSVVLFAVTLVGMTMGRDLLRIISLQSYFTVDQLVVRPSTSSLLLFLITFVIGLGLVGYLISLVWKLPPKEKSE
ncbi:MAG: hypothetical protein RBU29_08190 [bacterium]|jgi:hypothetical protein|nr:hypothetical protein [bacterium]